MMKLHHAWLVLAIAGAMGAAPRGAAADIHAGFSPGLVVVAAGDTFTAYVSIVQGDASFNAFDASIRFDPTKLSFDPITPVAMQRGDLMMAACSNTFHDFHVAADSLQATLSLLCNQTFVTGPGMLYRVRFRAGMTTGNTTISLGPFTEFYRAGLFVRPLDRQDLTVSIVSPTGVGPGLGASGRLELAAPIPNPRRGSAPLTLEFSLPAPDVVRFEVLDLQGRCLGRREGQSFAAGRHRISWSPPPLANGGYWLRLTTRSGASAVQRWGTLR
jgi:hypothetical protein